MEQAFSPPLLSPQHVYVSKRENLWYTSNRDETLYGFLRSSVLITYLEKLLLFTSDKNTG
ncbi:hypothetical protein E2C01_050508 [Portunus trituberculatus]|uniref:Uncharacterized protein n=1 Tax=Portunus trituberculatus TaxID=210409 RepID=A0A5B7GG59_PORTR|nr:hypothetical protein [Portunus trituberculatus]